MYPNQKILILFPKRYLHLAFPPKNGYYETDKFIEQEREKIMFRLWARTFKNNRMLQDTCIGDDSSDTRTHKVFRALDEVCVQFDLGRPLWLDKTVADFKRHSKTRFTQDNFIESIEFDYLEIQVIEED